MLGALPAISTLWHSAHWQIGIEYTLLLGVPFMGWVLVILDMPIYMVFEGRRFWPDFVKRRLVKSETARLMAVRGKIEQCRETDRRKYLEASVELRKFPMNEKTGEYEAQFPTRLGNLIAAYETYPNLRYGMAAVFYWYRIWLKIDKDTKEDVDDRASIADGLVYSSFSLLLSGTAWLVYSVLTVFKLTTTLSYVPPGPSPLMFAACFLLAAYLLYRASIYVHSQYGEVFKSIFDVYGKDIDVSDIIEEVSRVTGDNSLPCLTRREQLEVAWRYLHNFRVKCPACKKAVSPLKAQAHQCPLGKEADVALDQPPVPEQRLDVTQL
jgi:hypothetical protein